MLTWFWQILAPLNWATSLFIIVILNGSAITVAILLIRKFVPLKDFGAHRDFTAAIFCNFGVLYAVLLAFTIFNVQNSFNDAQTATIQEAGQLSQLYRDTLAFSDEDKTNMRQTIITYTNSIINQEWGATTPNVKTSQAFQQIWVALNQVNTSNQKQLIWYQQALTDLNQLTQSRAERLDTTTENISPEMWSFLILGKYCFLGFLCFFRPKNVGIYIGMAFILASITSASLFLIYSLDTPFAGTPAVSKDPYYSVLSVWQKTT